MKRNPLIVGLILPTFFVISFLANIIGSLAPDTIKAFVLRLTLAYLPSTGIRGHPLIHNETLGSKKRKVQV